MSDGQTEACEAIQQQNAQLVSVKLEPGESVKWHDGRQWRVGYVLMLDAEVMATVLGKVLVQTADGIYPVNENELQPYGPRCEACDGTGKRSREDEWDLCLGTGSYYYLPSPEECSQCGGSGMRS